MDLKAINNARIVCYGLFADLFSYIGKEDKFDRISKIVELLSDKPIDEVSEKALRNIDNFLKNKGYEALKEENNEIFFSPSTSFIPMTASFYDEARDEGKKKVEMVSYVLKSKYRKNTANYKDSEDNIEFVFAFMQKMISENYEVSVEVFKNILNSMVDEFIEKVYSHESADIYKDIAILLKVFIELERSILDISKPKQKIVEERIFKDPKDLCKRPAFKKAKRNLDEVTSL